MATTETTFPAGGGATDTMTPTPTTSAPTTAPTTTVTTQPTIDDGGEGTTVPTTAPTTAAPTTAVPTTVPTTATPTPTPTIEPDLCPLDPAPTGPVTAITGPTAITEPGFYRIETDAVNTTVPVWLEVRASNVTIDGMGHTIDGVDEDGTYGIRVRGDGPLANITIQNLTVTDFAYGIGLFDDEPQPDRAGERHVEHLRRHHGRRRRRQPDRVQRDRPGRRRHQPDRDATGRSWPTTS